MDDVLILGGGVIGLSLAYELATHGLRVQVIDRASPGREASWAGAGILPPARRDTAQDACEQLAGMSCQLHAEWAERLRDETGINTGYRRCGGIYVATATDEIAALQAAANHWQRHRIEAHALTAAELAQLEPALATGAAAREPLLAYHLPDEAQVRNPRHLKALLAACQVRGVTIMADCEAQKFERDGSRITAVETSRGRMAAGKFVIACGAWSSPLAEALGARVAVRPIRGQMVLFNTTVALSCVVNQGPRYLVPRFDGHVLAGSTEEEAGFEKRTTPEGVEGLLQLARELAPALEGATVEQTWAGLRPASGDGLPWIGPLPDLQNAWLAAGHFRAGLHLSTATAVVMGQLIRQETPAIDLTSFRLDRQVTALRVPVS